VKFEDVIDITVRIEKIGTKSITYLHEFAHAGEVVARGRITSVCIRELADHAIESIEIPRELREKLTQ
jgi:acyl-CoA thioesterase FadM